MDRAGPAGLRGRHAGMAGAGDGLLRGSGLQQAPRGAPGRPSGTLPECVPPPAEHRVSGNLWGSHFRPAGGGCGGNGGDPGPAARRLQSGRLPHGNQAAQELRHWVLGGLSGVCVPGLSSPGPRGEEPVPYSAPHGPAAGGGHGHPLAHGGV